MSLLRKEKSKKLTNLKKKRLSKNLKDNNKRERKSERNKKNY